MEWCIHITAKNGPNLSLSEKGVRFLEFSAVASFAEQWGGLYLGQKLPFSFHTSPLQATYSKQEVHRTTLVLNQVQRLQITLQEAEVFLPCCRGMWSKSQRSAGSFYIFRL